MRVAIFLLSISLAAAQSEKCAIEGTVLNAKTKEPIKKAQVRLFPAAESSVASFGAVTDSAGNFKLTGVDPGRYLIVASKSGFTQGPRRAGNWPSALTLAAGQTVKDLVFPLSPTAVIAGRVVDEDGDPMVNVQIQAMQPSFVQGRRQLGPVEYAWTDDQGYYRVHGLRAGRYYVSATYTEPVVPRTASGGAGAATPSQEEGYAPVYFPAFTDPAQAVPLRLREGEERKTVDFRLTPVHTVRVRGRISPVPPRPREASVTLRARDGGGFTPIMGRSVGSVNEKGSFELRGVTPGAYTLIAVWAQEGNQLSARQPVEVGQTNVEGIELALKPGVELKGGLRIESDAKPGLKLDSLSVHLLPDQSISFAGVAVGKVEADGSFTLRNLAEGVYRVTISMPQTWYLKAVTYRDADALEKGVVVGEVAGTLNVLLSPNSGSVDGTVTGDEDKPAIGATVVLVPETKRPDLYRTGATDQNGRFVLRGVAPGNYQLYSWDNLEPGAYEDPAFLEAYKDRAKKVSVEEKNRVTQDLPLLHAEAQ